METKKEIRVTSEIREVLLKEFPVSGKTVYNALHYETGGYTAAQIRIRAIELGGELWKYTPADATGEDIPQEEALIAQEGGQGATTAATSSSGGAAERLGPR